MMASEENRQKCFGNGLGDLTTISCLSVFLARSLTFAGQNAAPTFSSRIFLLFFSSVWEVETTIVSHHPRPHKNTPKKK